MSNSVAKTILIIEDDKPINDLIFDCLKGEGYNALQAFDVLEALKLLEGINCDLITLDFNLPAINGNQFIGLLPQTAINIPIIAISANPSAFDAAPQIKSIIAKPFDLDVLTNTLKQLLTE